MISWAFAAFLLQEGVDCRECHLVQGADHEGSIHAQKQIGCFECHGTDEFDFTNTTNPHRRRPSFTGKPVDLVAFCARCHAEVADAFRKSRHFDSLQSGELRACLACHRYHGTREAAFSRIGDRCLKCHGRDDPHHGTVQELLRAFPAAALSAGRLAARIDGAGDLEATPGITLRKARERAEEAALLVADLRVRQHAMKVDRLGADLQRVADLERQGMAEIEQERTSAARRPLWLAVFLVLLLIGGAGASLRLRRDTKA